MDKYLYENVCDFHFRRVNVAHPFSKLLSIFLQKYDSQDLCLFSVFVYSHFSSNAAGHCCCLFEAAVSEAHLSVSTGEGGG